MLEYKFPYELTLRPYQYPFWNAYIYDNIKRGVVVWPRRNGKDLISLNILITKALQRKGLYLYGAPFYVQVRSIIWAGSDDGGRKFLDYIPRDLVTKRNESRLELHLVNGSVIRLFGSDNIDSIVGNNPVGIVFTEFSLHKPDAWHYMRPILAANDGWALFNGTPRGLNHFYQMFQAAIPNPNWFVQYLTRDDTGVPTHEAIEEDRQSGMPESLIQQEYYCSWTASSEETLIPLDIIEPTVDRVLEPDEFEFAPKIVGADPAYAAKGDKAVIARRQGRRLYPLEKYQGLDNMSFASRIAKHIEEWHPDLVCIDSGRGEGVISRLYQLGYGDIVYPVHFSGKPYSNLYQNKRAEIWCKMKNWFLTDNKPSIPNDEDLIASLSAPMFEVNDRGYIQLESKKLIKKRLGASTDEADAVAVTFAEELIEREELGDNMRARGVSPEMWETMKQLEKYRDAQKQPYDPLTYIDKYYDTYAA